MRQKANYFLITILFLMCLSVDFFAQEAFSSALDSSVSRIHGDVKKDRYLPPRRVNYF